MGMVPEIIHRKAMAKVSARNETARTASPMRCIHLLRMSVRKAIVRHIIKRMVANGTLL